MYQSGLGTSTVAAAQGNSLFRITSLFDSKSCLGVTLKIRSSSSSILCLVRTRGAIHSPSLINIFVWDLIVCESFFFFVSSLRSASLANSRINLAISSSLGGGSCGNSWRPMSSNGSSDTGTLPSATHS